MLIQFLDILVVVCPYLNADDLFVACEVALYIFYCLIVCVANVDDESVDD